MRDIFQFFQKSLVKVMEGKILPIYIISGSEPKKTPYFFKVVAHYNGYVDIRWPNGYIHKKIPQQQVEGHFSQVKEEWLPAYIEPLYSKSTIAGWFRPTAKGGLKLTEIRERAKEMGYADVDRCKKPELRKMLLPVS